MVMEILEKTKQTRNFNYFRERLIPCCDCGEYIMTKSVNHLRCRKCAKEKTRQTTKAYIKKQQLNPEWRKKNCEKTRLYQLRKDNNFKSLTDEEQLKVMNKKALELLNDKNLDRTAKLEERKRTLKHRQPRTEKLTWD